MMTSGILGVRVAHWLAMTALLAGIGIAQAGAAGSHPDRVCPPGTPGMSVAELRPLAPDTWWVAAARGSPDAGNRGLTVQSLVVRDGSRLWLVGSGPTPAYARQLACAVRLATGLAVTDVVNTRAAPELAMGNSAFPRARIWALPAVAQTMRRRCADCLARLKQQIGDEAGASLRVQDIRTPQRTVGQADQRTGRLGPFDWMAVRRAPGEAVLLLRHRAAGVSVAQGLLWAGDLPDLRQTQAADLLQAWQALRAFAGDGRIVGEQGGVADATAVVAHEHYLQALQAVIGPALDRGELWGGGSIDSPEYAALPGYARRHPLNVQHLWLEMEGQLLR